MGCKRNQVSGKISCMKFNDVYLASKRKAPVGHILLEIRLEVFRIQSLHNQKFLKQILYMYIVFYGTSKILYTTFNYVNVLEHTGTNIGGHCPRSRIFEIIGSFSLFWEFCKFSFTSKEL